MHLIHALARAGTHAHAHTNMLARARTCTQTHANTHKHSSITSPRERTRTHARGQAHAHTHMTQLNRNPHIGSRDAVRPSSPPPLPPPQNTMYELSLAEAHQKRYSGDGGDRDEGPRDDPEMVRIRGSALL